MRKKIVDEFEEVIGDILISKLSQAEKQLAVLNLLNIKKAYYQIPEEIESQELIDIVVIIAKRLKFYKDLSYLYVRKN
jgi:hypothetical protein